MSPDDRHVWFKFYPSDWRSDEKLRLCNLETRGAWIEIICLMIRSEKPGHLLVNGKPPTAQELAKLIGCTTQTVRKTLEKLQVFGVFSTTSEGIIVSRRLVRDAVEEAQNRENGRKGGNPRLKGVNPPLNRGVSDGGYRSEPELDPDPELDPQDQDQDHQVAPNEDPDLVKIETHAGAVRASRRAPAQQGWTEPKGNPHANPANLTNGSEIRRHGQHAWCAEGRPNLCVTHSLHSEIIGATQKPEAEVKAWYLATVARFNGQAIGDDRFVFWRNELAAWIGTVTSAPTRKKATSDPAKDARMKLAQEYHEKLRGKK